MILHRISTRLAHRLVQIIKPHACTKCLRQRSQVVETSISNPLRHWYHVKSVENPWTAHRLTSRGVLLLKGNDVLPFLQGLITNDITSLEDGRQLAQYAMILNVQGRVVYDVILYNVAGSMGENHLLLECDARVRTDLMKVMKMYKIRRKVEIVDMTEENCVWAAFPPEGAVTPEVPVDNDKVFVKAQDPRVLNFGWRILTKASQSIADLSPMEEQDENCYHVRRYRRGIAEGTVDLPPANCFPLESNLVFMNGVSFSKGCYIGQELTARTQHTGVTRKRLMPLVFESEPEKLAAGDTIKTEKGKNAGKFRSSVGRYGLGLVRTTDTQGHLQVTGQDGTVYTATASVPDWWPEDEKEKLISTEKS